MEDRIKIGRNLFNGDEYPIDMELKL